MGSSPQAHATFRTPVLACSVILLGTLVLSAAGPASGTAGRQVSVPEVVPVSPISLVNVIDQLIGLAIGQGLMADYPGSTEFWSQVAARFANNPLAAFDLYNEPHDISIEVWLNGGTVPKYSIFPYQTTGMQQLNDAVRATGARNLVLVSGNNWANTPPTTLVRGSNIAYEVHGYTCPHSPSPNCDSSDPYRRNASTFAQAHGWGWIAWGLIGSVTPGGTAEPTPAAMPILAAFSSQS